MTDSTVSSIEVIAQFIADALASLLPFVGTNDPNGEPIRQLVRSLGWELPGPVPPSLIALRPGVTSLAENSAHAATLLERARSGDNVSIEETGLVLTALVAALSKVIYDFSQLEGQLGNELPANFINTTHIDRYIATRLIDGLMIDAAVRRFPGTARSLRAIGIIEIAQRDANPAISQPEFSFRQIHWERISRMFQDPGSVFQDVYGWGTADLQLDPLLDALFTLANAHAIYDYPSPGLIRAVAPGADPKTANIERSLEIPIINAGLFQLTAGITAIPTVSPGELQGLAVALFIEGAATTMEFPLTSTLSLIIGGSLEGSTGIALAFRPGQPLNVISDFDGSRLPVTGAEFSVGLSYKVVDDNNALAIISIPGGSRLELHTGHVQGGLVVNGSSPADFLFELGIDHGVFVLSAGEGDGFLSKILPADGVHSDFQVIVGVSFLHGIYFKGSASLEIQLPVHVSLGPIEIQSIYLILGFKDGKIPLEISGMISGHLGPLQASVERLGFTATVDFPDGGGNLGPLNLDLAFKPPNGVGLAIDAGVVKGGGYLYLDFDKGQYAGALELTISDFLSLKAIGLIDTKLPGGQPGFSLLIIITAEFDPGFQLGYGFVLIGVGGLLGLNRIMLLDPLAQGVRTGAINGILFPINVIENAPKIISDLRTIFPPQEGIFLIGPMAKIGWGTPTLISVALGVIIEIPGNVVILGRLSAALPDPDDAVLLLQVTFIGALEFDKRRIWFFASLFESHLLFIGLDGEMGLLMDFSDNPNFILSVGGFHPRFSPPPLPFPSPRRISLSIVNESWARIGAETYFAVTSNTVQMGVSAQAFFGFDSLSLEGYFSFDALLQFSPFYLIVELSAGFSVKVFGVGVFSIRLKGSLEGPTPWHIHGSAEIDLFFFSISVDVDATFGEHQADTLPPIEVLPKLLAEFEKLESWRATPPASGLLFVSLRDLGSSGTLVLHPVGTLQISQRFAPLNLPLDKIGNQKSSDIKSASLSVTAGALAVKGPTRENFAVAQFRNMDDAAKLSAPSFEKLDSGVEIGASGQPWASGPGAQRNVRYEQIIIDTAFKRYQRHFFKFWDGLFTHFRAGAAVSRASISQAAQKKMQPFDSKVAIADEQYTVAYQANNQAYTTTTTFSSYAEAQAHMDGVLQQNPSLTDEIHVIPFAEVNQAK